MAIAYNHLTDVIAAVNANLVTNGTFLATQISTGNLFNAQQDSPPRLVWVPSADSYEGAVMNHGNRSGAGRSLRTRAAGVDAHIWGGDFASTEDLITGVIQACQMTVTASSSTYETLSGVWRQDGYEAFGFVYMLKLAFKIPVQDMVPTTATILTLPQTNQMKFLDGQVVASP